MRASRFGVAALAICFAVAGWTIVGAGQAGQLPLEPLGDRGEALFPYLEGWFPNEDGTFSILFGYHNRNAKQTFDIPIGPANRVEPGSPDQGQPTHFLPNRNNRMFTVTVPKDFGTRRITWTLTANGITQAVSAWLNPPYFVEPYLNSGTGNTPPVIRIGTLPEHTGPPRGVLQTISAVAGQPLPLAVFIGDKGNTIVLDPDPQRTRGGRGRGRGGRGDGPPAVANITWKKYRGPGDVNIADDRLLLTDSAGATLSTTATFGSPGEYWLRVVANEGNGDGGSGQCCSTSALIRVNVKGGPTAQ